MLRDIFTLCPLEKPGLEHILPSLLGGKLARRDLVEQTTNNLLGSSIEPALVDTFKFLLNALRFKSRRGKTVGYNLEAANEPMYRLASGFKPELKRTGISEQVVDGKVVVSITARDENEARKLFEAAQRKYGQLDTSTVKAFHRREFINEPLEHEILIGGLQLRAIAKTAFEGCAVALGNQAICGPEFNPIRDWIFDGVRSYKSFEAGSHDEAPYYCNHDYRLEVWAGLPMLENAPFQHRVFVFSGPEVGGAWGAVELFGHIRFTVLLCDDAKTTKGSFGYLVNPVSGIEERTPVFENSTQAKFVKERQVTPLEVQKAFESLMSAIEKQQQDDLFEGISRTVTTNSSFKEGEIFDEGHAAAISQNLANEFVHHLFRISREEPCELADILPRDALQDVNDSNGSEEDG